MNIQSKIEELKYLQKVTIGYEKYTFKITGAGKDVLYSAIYNFEAPINVRQKDSTSYGVSNYGKVPAYKIERFLDRKIAHFRAKLVCMDV